MSDTESSSSGSVQSRCASPQPKDYLEKNAVDLKQGGGDEGPEGDPVGNDEASDSDSSTSSALDRDLSIEWEPEMESQDGDSDNRPYADPDMEPRLIDFVVVPGLCGRWDPEKRLIYFITHDIGGIIVKDALVRAGLDHHAWKDISEMTRVVIFNGCLHRYSNKMDLQDRLTRFLFKEYDFSTVIKKARLSVSTIPGLSDAIEQINGLFIESKVPLRSWIVNVYSPRDGETGIHRVFDIFSATMGIPLEKRIPDTGDSDFTALKNHLVQIELDIKQPIEPNQYRLEKNLLALASPVYPLRSASSGSNPLSHLPDYQTWLKSSSPQVLYIHGNNRVREVTEQVFYSLEDGAKKAKRRAMVLYFSFDRWDVRCDSIRDMIATFIAQIANHHPNLTQTINSFFSQLQTERGWTEADLVQSFERFRTSDEVEQTMIVINHFDECTKGSRKLFLDNLIYRHHNDEFPWKVVVTSHKPGALTDELSGPFSVPIDLSSPGMGSPFYHSGASSAFDALLDLRPDILPRESASKDIDLIERLDPPIQHIIYKQAAIRGEWPDETSIQDIFSSFDLAENENKTEEILEAILDWVLKQFPNQAILGRLFSWLLYAVRPLTVWELATVLSLGTSQDRGHISPGLSVVEDLIAEIQKWLAGIVVVDNNEVRLSHPHLHYIMTRGKTPGSVSGQERYLWDEIRDTAHSNITTLCLHYMSRDNVHEYIDKTFQVTDSKSFETPTFPDRTNLASYAVQAWMHHYVLSSSRPDISVMTSQAGLAQTVVKAHWALANLVTRSTTCLKTLFSVFAGLGLPHAVRPLDHADTFQGLLEAARKDQVEVAQGLIEDYQFTENEMWEALEATSSSGNEDMMLSLLDRIISKRGEPTEIQWPPVLIYRAAFLNLDRFAEKILALGCSPDPDVEWKVTMTASPLFQATCFGHLEVVRILLKYDASFEHTGLHNRNPFHVAAAQGHPEVLESIVKEGRVDIDYPSEQKFTALYLAVVYGHYMAAERLLNLGADPNMGISPNSRDDDQWTPLGVASEDGFKRCVKLLLDKGANPNIYGRLGVPLQAAVGRGHLEICDMLLAAGADPRSELIKTPLLADAVGKRFEDAGLHTVEWLLDLDLDVNAKDSSGTPVLSCAVQSYYAPQAQKDKAYEELCNKRDLAVGKLLEHKADPNLADSYGVMPLYFATVHRQYNLTKILLEAGASPNQSDEKRFSFLFGSLRELRIARLLLEKGANPDYMLASGWTSLTYAAYCGLADAVKLLLEHGASIDLEYGAGLENVFSTSYRGWTPLMFAAEEGDPDSFRVLSEAGADLQHTAGEYKRPVIHEACFHSSILPIFLEFANRVDVDQTDNEDWTALHWAGIPFDNVKRLVNAGANIHAETYRGETPLIVAAESDLVWTTYLVDKGANIHHTSPWIGSALTKACFGGKFDIIKFLFNKGADVNAVCCYYGGTPLQALCFSSLEDEDGSQASQEHIFRYLLDQDKEHPFIRPKERRADVTIKAGFFSFAINTAALAKGPTIIDLILEQEGATVDVRDDTGRMPIHFAALNGIRNFETILAKGGDIHAKDKLGRTALHCAAQAGRFQVVQKIVLLLDDKASIDTPDIDGWTPLCWAARGPLASRYKNEPSEESARSSVIKFLIEKGANLNVMATMGDEKWSPVKISFYHKQPYDDLMLGSNVDPADGKEPHEEPPSTSGKQEAKDKKERGYKMGVMKEDWECDICLSTIYGFCYSCKTSLIHSPEHEFEKDGEEEYEEGAEEKSGSRSSSSSDSDSDNSSDDSGI
ncbi:hypothetical protein F53441_5484 [Fusarium austroafricanum]|uniref:Nephrocystin 3-like N-terminal domain-containing protein n=1 Tax=Fusarium austroafricanum TaxID=2364996 RepID=A0A8H4KKZ2_9HYPO|nr:hypothetical protein F53441_5484 [Fusarium austroafricanum]